MRQLLLSVMVVSTAVFGTLAHGQSVADIPLNPGERIIAIDGVPVDGAAAPTSVSKANPATKSAMQVSAEAVNIEGNLTRTDMAFSHTPGNTALEKANHERRRNGVGPLRPDPQLQQLALQKARTAAARGFKNHVGGSLGGARAEGVGFTNGRFLSCCLDMPASYGGAAMVKGADGWYCCLLVR